MSPSYHFLIHKNLFYHHYYKYPECEKRRFQRLNEFVAIACIKPFIKKDDKDDFWRQGFLGNLSPSAATFSLKM